MKIPSEIWRNILREATDVPLAFEYPLRNQEIQEPHVAQLISESMTTKCAIVQVCKIFHDIGIEFLYEIVVVRQYARIRPLVEVLRRDRGSQPRYGWWCRRLDVRVMLGTNNRWNYKTWGYLTLWGLLPSCPQICDLRCSLPLATRCYRHLGGSSAGRDLMALPVSETLLQMLATSYKALRYLEFSGSMTVSTDLMVRLLHYLPELRACTLRVLLAPTDAAPSASSSDGETSSSDEQEQENDDDDDDDDDCETKINADEPEDGPENEEYKEAKQLAHWPPLPGGEEAESPSLLKLRGLSLRPVDVISDISEWTLPALQQLAVQYYDVDCMGHLTTALEGRYISLIRDFTFRGPLINIWRAVDLLPLLEEYSFALFGHRNLPAGPLRRPHLHLSRITAFHSRSYEAHFTQCLTSIYEHVQAEKLPVLRHVWVRGSVYEEEIATWRSFFDGLPVSIDFGLRNAV